MTDALAVIIAAIISALVGFLTALITTIVSINKLELQLKAKYRSELAKRQIDACEMFWQIFGPTSLTEGEHRIIRKSKSPEPILDIREAEDFVDKFQETFSSKAGLYLSEETRRKLHQFRDQVIEIKKKSDGTTNEIKLVPADVQSFWELRKAARLALRDEVGSTNLTVAHTEYRAYGE